MSRGRKGRSPDQIRKDRAEVARLYLEGWTQADIGAQRGLSRQQIGYDLEAVRQEWLQSSLVDFNAKKAEELARIDKLEREYWSAWEASKQERQTSTTEQTTGAEGERLKAAIRKTDQTGDPRYLAGVERCIEQRCKLLGLNAPTETRLTGQGGGPIRTAAEVTGHVDLFARAEQYVPILRQLRERDGGGSGAGAEPDGTGGGGLPAGAVPGERLRELLAAAPADAEAGAVPGPDVP